MRARHSSSGSGSGSRGIGTRKWTVRSIVGRGAGAAIRMNGAGISASQKNASDSESIGRGSTSPSQPPVSIGCSGPANGHAAEARAGA